MNQSPATSVRPAPSVIPPSNAQHTPDGLLLSEKQNPSCLLIFLLVFTLLWNLITCPIALMFLLGSGAPDLRSPLTFLALIPMIFVIVGVVLLVITIRMGLVAMRFGAAELLIERLPLRLGDRVALRFRRRVRGNRMVSAVEGRLVCREWVRYRVGTDTRTMTHERWSQPLALPPVPPFGSGEIDLSWALDIPADQPPSFTASDNALEWLIEIKLVVERSPDPTATFLLPVLPEVLR